MAWKWTLPDEMATHVTRTWQTADHLGLLLDKLTPYAEYEYQERGQPHRGYRLGPKNLKRDWLQDALQNALDSEAAPAVLQAQRDRQLEMVQAACGSYALLFTAAPLIVGLGAGHVLETAITLDRNTGAPLIPGSALKGLARTVGLVSVAESLNLPEIDWLARDNNEDSPPPKLARLEQWILAFEDLTAPDALECLADEVLEIDSAALSIDKKTLRLAADFRAVFGTTDCAGDIVFLDGLYAGDRLPKYHIDIMNPHFSKYYTGDSPPSDDQSPVPVPYLTVAAGQPFVFAVLPRTPSAAPLIKRAGSWLIRGLKEFGVGAKTAQGYGLFRSP
jgi:CRISPR-associated protein Cmr6